MAAGGPVDVGSAVIVSPRRRGRPPRVRDDGGSAREALLRVGVDLLSERGYVASGLDDLLAAAGVPKGSFYHYYPSKEAYGAAVIDRYAERFAALLDRLLNERPDPPLERLRAFTDNAERAMRDDGFRRGCLVGNLGQEMAALPEDYRQRLIATLHDWQHRTAECLRAAQAAGHLSPAIDADDWAMHFWVGWEGAVLRARLERSAEPLRRWADHYFEALRAMSAMSAPSDDPTTRTKETP